MSSLVFSCTGVSTLPRHVHNVHGTNQPSDMFFRNGLCHGRLGDAVTDCLNELLLYILTKRSAATFVRTCMHTYIHVLRTWGVYKVYILMLC